jgi:signal transduction histidine kinase
MCNDIKTRSTSGRSREDEIYRDLLAHDMGNILQAIQSYADLLEATGEPSDDILSGITQQVRRGNLLISNATLLSRVLRGKMKSDPVKLEPALMEAVDTARSDFPGARVDARLPGSDTWVRSSPLLGVAFENLIFNALVHNPAPDRWALVSCPSSSRRGGRRIKIAFEDNGPGIRDELKDRIFENGCSRVEDRSRGIGLSLVKMLVEGCGGVIRAEDRVPGDPSLGSRIIVGLLKSSPGPGLSPSRPF